jgi:hypothetical protein
MEKHSIIEPCFLRAFLPKFLLKYLPCVMVVPNSYDKNNSNLRYAALPFIAAHETYEAPFEEFVYTTGVITKNKESIGKFRIRVSRVEEEDKIVYDSDSIR